MVIIERRRGRSYLIRFGEEGARILLKGVESFRNEPGKNSRGMEWKENGRRYSPELRKNDGGRFILCSVVDLEGKRHQLCFPKGNGLINWWTLLEEAIQIMGTKENRGEKRKPAQTTLLGKAEIYKRDQTKDQSFTEITTFGRKNKDTIWLDISECIPKGDLGLLKKEVVGSWKSQLATDLLLTEVEAWAKRA